MRDRRTHRQRLVAEIGEAGQTRITSTTAVVGARGLSGDVEVRFLAGAGFGALRVADEALARAAREVRPDVLVSVDETVLNEPARDAGCLDPSADAVVQGALRALAKIRAALL